jgi:hypothetical protein
MRKVFILFLLPAIFLSAEASLPLHETFNTDAWTENWTVSEGGSAQIQSEVAVEGSALQINSGSVTRSLSSERDSIWVSFHAKITETPQNDPEVSNSNTSVAFFINSNNYLVVYNSTNKFVTAVQLQTNEWTRFDLYCDYRAKQWMLTVITDAGGTTNQTEWLSFYSPGSHVESLLIANNGNNPVYFDELRVQNTEPADSIVARIDTSGNGIPDWWEKHHFGNTGVTNILDKARNGIMNLREAYIAGINPDDPDDVLRVSKADANGRNLRWDRKPGRVYDIDWAPDLTTNFLEIARGITADEFEDPETDRTSLSTGFYKIRVRKP